ncbi:MAG: hypothetical protein GXP55_14860 [Deltaproteobacteria bacterium]|nr:hypothetical protein [Deltaproteobacteria bacterium]
MAEFAHSEVNYALLGGYAVGYYAVPRATKDLDILVSRSANNLERLAEALQRFGAPSKVTRAALTLGPSEILYMGVPPVRIDILASADGIDTDATLSRARRVHVGELPVFIVALADLMANKAAAGRPQDLADVAALKKLGRDDSAAEREQ